MPLCDLCGKEARLVKTKIETAVLTVCPVCAGYGEILEKVETETPRPRRAEQAIPRNEQFSPQKIGEAIDENYAVLIKTAREKANLTQEQLAKAIAEKENLIHRIETKQQEPPVKVAKKLEQLLRIKLITKEKAEEVSSLKDVDFSETELTIGDLLKLSNNFKDPSE